MTAAFMRFLTPARGVLAVLGASLVAATAALALPAGVTKLEGTSRGLPVELTYSGATWSINGFAVEYTCRGQKPENDSDVYTIVDGKDDSKPLSRIGAKGRIKTTLKGQITRFTEDGPRRIGHGKLTLNARIHRSATKRIVRGTMRVRSRTCPSARTLRLRVIGPR